MDEPIVWYEGTGTSTRRFLSADERGSIISVTDGSGTVLGLNRYDEFGMPQSTNLGRFQYTGQIWLGEIALYYYKARVYDPELGRFLQTDPIGYADSPNLYAYVLNDPVNFVDPLGLDKSAGPDIIVTGLRPMGCQGVQKDGLCMPGGVLIGLVNSGVGLGGEGVGGPLTDADAATCAAALEEAKKDQAAVERARAAWPILEAAGDTHNVDPSILGAIGVRESGFRNIPEYGGGSGLGVFQLTNQPGVSRSQAFDLKFSSNYAAGLVRSNYNLLSKRFPHFTVSQRWQAALAAYNFGPRNIRGDPSKIDVGTRGHNYGRNVMELSKCF